MLSKRHIFPFVISIEIYVVSEKERITLSAFDGSDTGRSCRNLSTHFLKITLEWVAQRNGIVKKLIYPKNTLIE